MRVFWKTSCLVLTALWLSACATPAANKQRAASESQPVASANSVLFTIALPEAGDLPDIGRADLSATSNGSLVSGFSSGATAAGIDQQLIPAVLSAHGLRKVSQFPLRSLNLEAVVVEVDGGRSVAEVIDALARDRRVESVQSVQPFKLMAYNDPYYSLQSSGTTSRLDLVHSMSTGKNVSVGIIDTGVDRHHPELAGRIVYSSNLVGDDPALFDDDEHGTAVAGVIGSAANNDVGIVGVAPDVSLMVFKACHQTTGLKRPSCDSVSIIQALNDVLIQQPDVLNLSLAGPWDPVITRLIRAAYRQGITIVAAVDETVGQQKSFPASLDEVIGVGAAVDGQDTLITPLGTILAPGTNLLTTTPGAAYGFRSGSSMATAYVSGIVALMKEKNPAMTNRQILYRLQSSSRTDTRTQPFIDLCAAVTGVAGYPENGTHNHCGHTPVLAAQAGISRS